MSYLISYQVFSTRGLVLSWGVRSQTGAQNPIVQGGLVGTSPFYFVAFSSYFQFKNAFSTILYKLAWHITTSPNFVLLIFVWYIFKIWPSKSNSNMIQNEHRADTSKCLLFSFSCLLFWNMALQIHNLFLQADISQVLHFHSWFLGFVLVRLWRQTNHSSISFLCQYIFTRL